MMHANYIMGSMACALVLGACAVEDEEAGRPSAPSPAANAAPAAPGAGDAGETTVGVGTSPGSDAGPVTTSTDGGGPGNTSDAATSSLPGRFVAVGYDGRRAMSLDGKIWTADARDGSGNVDGPQLFRDIAFANGLFVAVGGGCDGGCKGRIAVTKDGVSWKDVAPASADNWLGGVAYGNGTWVAVGGFSRVLRSADGLTWTAADLADGSIRNMRFANGWFVAVGDGGRRKRSQDGLAWVDATSGGTDLHSLAYGNGVWVAAGYGGRRVRSTDDGATWTSDVASDDTESVAFANGQFFATAEGGAIMTSTDGAAWTHHAGPGASTITAGRPGGQTQFIGFGWVATRRASADGLAWSTAVVDDKTSAFAAATWGE